jgi:hypothetical protein
MSTLKKTIMINPDLFNMGDKTKKIERKGQGQLLH